MQFQYDSVAAAESARLGVESSVVQLNEDDGSVEGAFDGDVTLEATISNKTQNSSHRASYSAVGWNTLAPDSKGDIAAPVVVTDLDSMLKARYPIPDISHQYDIAHISSVYLVR